VTEPSRRESPPLRLLIWMLPCLAAWSLPPRLAVSMGILDPLGYLFWSCAVSTVCLIIATALTGHWTTLRSYSTTDLRRLAALSSLGAFASYALLYSAYASCAGQACDGWPATVLVTQYTWPAFATLWSVLLLRDTLTCRRTLAVLAGIAAVAASTAGNTDHGSRTTLLLVLGAAMIFGLYSTLLRRVAYEAFSSMTVGFAVATALSWLAMMPFSRVPALPDRTAMWTASINGIVNALALVGGYRALQTASSSKTVPWIALTPLAAALFAGTAIEFQTRHWIGIAFVTASALLATLPSTQPASEPLLDTPPRFDLVEEST